MPHGSIVFDRYGICQSIYGGPYYDLHTSCRSDHVRLVKMAREIQLPCDVDIPTADFQTPHPAVLKAGIKRTLAYMMDGKDIAVGCMGGVGRTGLFLAAMAKVRGVPDPVAHVRACYLPHAVETAAQQQFIADLDVSDIQKQLKWLPKFYLKRKWQQAAA